MPTLAKIELKLEAKSIDSGRLYPDATMAHVLDQWCDYRRYCYNKALELWMRPIRNTVC